MNKTIGVFDSGIGGLTVLRGLVDACETYDYLYVGDTRNVPYGTKSASEIEGFVDAVSRHLVDAGVDAIVIACNTASVNRSHLRLDIPVFDILGPTAHEAAQATRNGRILVLATDFTARAGAYSKALAPYKITPVEVGCSPFVDVVESGRAGSEQARDVVTRSLSPYKKGNYDTVVLGCTHFGALRHEIAAVFPQATQVDGIRELATRINQAMPSIQGSRDAPPRVRLQTTGGPDAFAEGAATLGFTGHRIEHIVL